MPLLIRVVNSQAFGFESLAAIFALYRYPKLGVPEHRSRLEGMDNRRTDKRQTGVGFVTGCTDGAAF